MSEIEPKKGRAKRFLSPSQKCEIWLQLVRQEATVAEVAASQQVDRSTIIRIKQVAKDGALMALAASKPAVKGRERDYELEPAKAEIARLSEACKELAVKLTLVEGKDGWGLSGRAPHRVDAATKAGLLGLIEEATDAGWPIRRACGVLELGEVRVHRWYARRARGQLADRAPGGGAVQASWPTRKPRSWRFSTSGARSTDPTANSHTGAPTCLECGSHRPRSGGSSTSLTCAFVPCRGPGRVVRGCSLTGWNTHRTASGSTTRPPFTRSGMAVLIIEDLVSRKWITEIVSSEETSTQVELAFTQALELEGLLERVDARHDDGRVDLAEDDQARPILLAVSDNGPQMTSGSTREFMAMCAIAQHFGRPGTPTDQAWIESLNGHIKIENPHLLAIEDPATLRAELAVVREHYNGVRLHAGIGYVTPNDEHEGRGEQIPV